MFKREHKGVVTVVNVAREGDHIRLEAYQRERVPRLHLFEHASLDVGVRVQEVIENSAKGTKSSEICPKR